jgi:primosomal protein N' (replication factor Y)
MASVTGERTAVAALAARVPSAQGDAVLGPVEVPGDDAALAPPVRLLVRVPWQRGRELARELAASLAVRSARREGGQVRVQLDPKEIV